MLDAIRPLLLRFLRVPAEPAAPREQVRIFRAAHNYYRYRLLRWGMAQAGTLIGLLIGFAFLRTLPGTVPDTALTWIRIGEALAAAAFLVQLPFSYALVRLDFEMRWYIVGERSLRIREGIASVREQTMTYANIQNTAIRQGPLQRLLGIADLEVQTAGGGGGAAAGGNQAQTGGMHVGTFRGVEDAAAIRDVIREQVRRYRDAGLGDPDDAAADAVPPAGAGEHAAVDAAREVLAAARGLRTALAVPR
jgi:membrane protein YdbS with pleckstrin-like domain